MLLRRVTQPCRVTDTGTILKNKQRLKVRKCY
jgi:hypothetical protein